MVELETSIGALAVDSSHVYLAQPDDGTIKRIVKQGGVVETIAEDQANVDGLLVVDDVLYWTTYEDGRSEIRMWGHARNKWSTVAIETGQIRSIAPHGEELVYVVANDSGSRIRTVPRLGGTSRDLAKTDATSFVGIAGEQVVWGGGYQLWHAPPGSAGQLISDQFQLLGLVTHGEDIYTWDDHTVRRFSPGAAAVTVTEGQSVHVTVSGDWLVIGDGQSVRVHLASGAGDDEQIAPKTTVSRLAADHEMVYWVDTRGEGPRVLRAPLPAVQATAQTSTAGK
jgi:hypothetical protein